MTKSLSDSIAFEPAKLPIPGRLSWSVARLACASSKIGVPVSFASCLRRLVMIPIEDAKAVFFHVIQYRVNARPFVVSECALI